MFLLELSLLAPQVVVDDDLLLQVVQRQVAHAVSLLDLVREGLVARLELVQDVRIHVQVILAKDKLSRRRVLHFSL